MADAQRIGGCLWRVFQIGLLVGLLGMVLVVIVSLDLKGEREEVGVETREEDSGGGVFGAVKRLLGFSGEEEVDDTLRKVQEEQGTGHIDLTDLLKERDKMRADEGVLAEGTTGINQLVLWQVIGDDIYYRIILTPYDRPAHQLMMSPSEALFISFEDDGGTRLAPKAAAARIETRTLRVATEEGYAVGWFSDGRVSLEGQDGGAVSRARVGWIFSDALHSRLRAVQRPRGEPGGAVQDPHGIKTGVE